jgi:hypothetical protein
MTASLQSPEDLVNDALSRIGFKRRVANLYEGTPAANAALNFYAQTRDDMLRAKDWGFAQRNIVAALLKSAPVGGYIPPTVWNPAVNPPLPWLFSYSFPSDCLKVRALKPAPLFVPNFDPQDNVWNTANDATFTPAQRVILCNVPNAILVYTGQVTDPVTWDVAFVEEFCAGLARRLAPILGDLNVAKLEAADEQVEAAMAEGDKG